MNLLQRMFGKTKPDPKVKSDSKAKPTAKKKAVKKPVASPAPAAASASPAPAPAPANTQSLPQPDEAAIALLKTLEARKADDPLIMVKACSTEMLNRLILAMRDKRGMHAETLLTALGALGGFACQMSARATGATLEPRENGGKTYYFSPAINKPLAETQTSILALAQGAAQALGAQSKPNVQEMFKHAIDTMGKNTFGIPRVDNKHRARDLPENYARALWPVLIPTIKLFCKDPNEWPIVFGYAVQQVMKQSKDVLDPALAVTIVMEAAVPISKIDPGPDVVSFV